MEDLESDVYVKMEPVCSFEYIMLPFGKSMRLWYNPFYSRDFASFWINFLFEDLGEKINKELTKQASKPNTDIIQKGIEWECLHCGEVFGRVENAFVHVFKEHQSVHKKERKKQR